MAIDIVGAGLSGLIAGHIFPDAQLFERQEEESYSGHKALLRFRSEAVSDATGIPFKKVRVHKAIWYDNAFREPNIQLANKYSVKCTGKILPRSIWNLDTVDRFIAPDDVFSLLTKNLKGRITWGIPYDFSSICRPVISTIPMSGITEIFPEVLPLRPGFHYKPIKVYRAKIPNCDVYQTVYFPGTEAMYRASLTGDTLIVETASHAELLDSDISKLQRVFWLPPDGWDFDLNSQRYGKISPIKETWRRHAVRKLTAEHGIYSLGRFATWRNILLDDVVHDCAVIKRMMLADEYQQDLIAAQIGG